MTVSVKLSPIFNDEQLDNNGLPLAGGLLYWYLAGTSTPVTIYTTSAGAVAQATPIVLNTRGEVDNPCWLPTGQNYKAVLADASNNIIRTVDNIPAINDFVTPTNSEWLLFGAVTYQDATHFTCSGDQTGIFTVNRRLQLVVGGVNQYASISASSYATGTTTVTVINDTSALNSGLTSAYYGLINPLHSSIPVTVVFPSGTVMPFYQASPPTGWTAAGSIGTDYMMRVVAAASSGGTNSGAGLMSPILNDKIPSHTHIATSNVTDPTHSHNTGITGVGFMTTGNGSFFSGTGVNSSIPSTGAASTGVTVSTTNAANAGASNWTPRYADFCLGSKS